MRIKLAIGAVTAVLALTAGPAGAAVLDPVTIDSAPTAVTDIGVAPDGSGALVYLKTVGLDDQVWASVLTGGTWAPAVRIDPDDGDDEAAPRVAVGNGGRVLVGYLDASAGTLKYRLKPSAAAGFGLEGTMRVAGGVNWIRGDWDLDMNAAGVSYAAWIELNPGTLKFDARAWRSDGTTQATSLRLQKEPNAESVIDGSNGPNIRVAVDDAGSGMVAFGQSEGGGESTYLLRLAGVTPGTFVDVEVPSLLGESLSSPFAQLDLDAAGAGLAWFSGSAMYTAGGHAVGVPVSGDLAGPPALLDAYPASENDNVERPDVALNAGGQGLFASEPNLKAGVFGGSISGTTASPAQRLDSSPHDPDSEVPVVAIGDGGRGFVSWTRDVANDVDGPYQVVGRVWNGSAFDPEALLVDSAKIPFSLSSADGAGASRLGDVAVLTEREVGGVKTVVVGRYDAPPTVPVITSGAGAASFTWSAAEALWSPLASYKVVIDDAVVATLGTDTLSYPAPSFSPGTHSWRILAVDALGQETPSTTQTLTVPGSGPASTGSGSPVAPQIKGLSQSKARWTRDEGTVFRLTLSERSTLQVELRKLVPGRKLAGRCLKPKPALRKKPRCTRALKQGTLTRSGQNGRVEIAFSGRMDNGKRLAPGRYEAVFLARNGAGTESKPATLRFTIAKR
jgi:hypothetical protein